MAGREWPWIIAVTLSACTALGVAAYSLASGELNLNLIAGALIALGAGLVFAQMRDAHRSVTIDRLTKDNNRLAREVGNVARESRDVQRSYSEVSQQIGGLRQQTDAMAGRLEQGLNELKQHQQTLMQRVTAQATNRIRPLPPSQRRAARLQPQLAQATAPAMAPQAAVVPASSGIPFGDALTLSLEPVINLATYQTAHYRMLPGLLNTAGQDVLPEVFHHEVERSGLRSKLDCFVIEEAAGLLQSLRQRDPNLCIFVPVSAATLCRFDALQAIVASLGQHYAVARGVILEISHAMLAGLPEAGLEGMAYLARAGVGFSLSQSAVSGIDLAALQRVNMRFLCFTGAAVGLETSLSSGLASFVAAARSNGIDIVVTHVSDRSRIAALSHAVQLACGPAFALPRRLHRNAGTGSVAAAGLTAAA